MDDAEIERLEKTLKEHIEVEVNEKVEDNIRCVRHHVINCDIALEKEKQEMHALESRIEDIRCREKEVLAEYENKIKEWETDNGRMEELINELKTLGSEITCHEEEIESYLRDIEVNKSCIIEAMKKANEMKWIFYDEMFSCGQSITTHQFTIRELSQEKEHAAQYLGIPQEKVKDYFCSEIYKQYSIMEQVSSTQELIAVCQNYFGVNESTYNNNISEISTKVVLL